MKILFTGASSFTGYWIVKELSQKGHEVTATYTFGSLNDYTGIRKTRVEKLLNFVNPIWNCRFGDETFLQLIDTAEFNVLCHHAADASNYKSPDFDFIHAVENNSQNIQDIIKVFKKKAGNLILLTGSVFEGMEGRGDDPLIAFSKYGLSKQLTSEIFKYFCAKENIKLAKFVIPNPFGPYEEPRFTDYLINSWFNQQVPSIKTPLYIRDNIHVSLLAKAYEKFMVQSLINEEKFEKLNPSGYIESQGEFTRRFSAQMNKQLNIECPFLLADQVDFNEPLIRTNNLLANEYIDDWNEEGAWNELAEYYRGLYKNG